MRCQCAKGLARIGVSTFRTLLIGLYDKNPNVRKVVENEVIENFPPESIVSEYSNRRPQLMSIKYSIKDLLDKKVILTKNMEKYVERLLNIIEFYEKEQEVQQRDNYTTKNFYLKDNQEVQIDCPTSETDAKQQNNLHSKMNNSRSSRMTSYNNETEHNASQYKHKQQLPEANNSMQKLEGEIYNTKQYPEFKQKIESVNTSKYMHNPPNKLFEYSSNALTKEKEMTADKIYSSKPSSSYYLKKSEFGLN